jgi:hypothetical protein
MNLKTVKRKLRKRWAHEKKLHKEFVKSYSLSPMKQHIFFNSLNNSITHRRMERFMNGKPV